ncbi:SDR family NAD(P)-dependent oxidoreductase [Desulfovibrio intestinalis]|uniref:3-oxoacyl-[acyl-carrier protein] reductase n=1 Tax=Desulfovibrio intestinalis TaxID=58621 RepID=A0A7W8C1Z7_9BACT|nr:SDR family oxidoreductase [Desulfovibrio intestinalis]MBB5142947.1 3-oxoacyl-[acyl-carrier protein] reductase [Desulfovibrio intestinalis]
MAGRHVVITGISGGLGRHLAMRAMQEGYGVTGLCRTPPADIPCEVLSCDVTVAEQVADCFARLRHVPLWGVINAAGIASMNLTVTTPPETMRRIVEVNLLGTMYCSAQAGRLLARRKGGRIINFSSIAVALGLEGESAYVAAKAGVEGFTRAFSREMSSWGVTVNAVAPGPIPTQLIAGVPQHKLDALVERQVVRRQGTLEDVWKTVHWLLDDASGMISGQCLHVGGV